MGTSWRVWGAVGVVVWMGTACPRPEDGEGSSSGGGSSGGASSTLGTTSVGGASRASGSSTGVISSSSSAGAGSSSVMAVSSSAGAATSVASATSTAQVSSSTSGSGASSLGSTTSSAAGSGSSSAGAASSTAGSTSQGGSSTAASSSSASSIPDTCVSPTGLRAPLPACTPQTPCDRPAAELGGTVLTVPSSPPNCAAVGFTEMDTRDVAGFTRHACILRPTGATMSSPRPLVLWFHPGGEGADNIRWTQLVSRAQGFDLSGDAQRPGFFLVVPQGRNLRFPTLEPRDGRHHDFYFRDLASPSANPDVAYADALVDFMVSTGAVDPQRIYVMGWSNGAFFGQLYALARYNTPTPGTSSRVAAASVFSAGNPFDEIRWDPFVNTPRVGATSCAVTPPAVPVPIHLVYRTCDAAVATSAEQAACFATEPGYTTLDWLQQAAGAGLSITGLMLAGRERANMDATAGTVTSFGGSCPASCPLPLTQQCPCLANHLLWPDGAYESGSSNLDRELDMLAFLRSHVR